MPAGERWIMDLGGEGGDLKRKVTGGGIYRICDGGRSDGIDKIDE